MRKLVRILPIAVCLSFASVPRSASAQERDPAAAQVLFEQGRRALEKRDYKDACAKFAESQRLDPAAGTLMNLATCEEQRGQFASAWQHWREAADQLDRGDERVGFAEKRARALEARLPYLTVKLAPGTPSDVTVSRNGIALGSASWGVPLPIDPGDHRIVVSGTRREDRVYKLSIAEAEKKEIDVEAGPELPPEPQPMAASASGSPSSLGWVLGGIGLAGVGAGVVTGLMVASKQDTVDEQCSGGRCSQSGFDAAESGKTLLVVNAASWIVGVAGLASGAYFVISSSNEKGSERTAGVRSLPGGAALTYSEAF